MADSHIAPEWRQIPNIAGYEVSDTGLVRRTIPGNKTFPGKILRPKQHQFGYHRYSLTINGKNKDFEAHRLVALAFIGPPPTPRHQVAHKDGDPRNNASKNLRWATQRENEGDKVAHGTSPAGVRNAGAKLNDDLVKWVRDDYAVMRSLAKVAARYGIAFQTVSKIVNRRSWGHVP